MAMSAAAHTTFTTPWAERPVRSSATAYVASHAKFSASAAAGDRVRAVPEPDPDRLRVHAGPRDPAEQGQKQFHATSPVLAPSRAPHLRPGPRARARAHGNGIPFRRAIA